MVGGLWLGGLWLGGLWLGGCTEVPAEYVPMQAVVTSIKDVGAHGADSSDVVITLSVTPEQGASYPVEVRGLYSRADLTTYVAGTTVNVKVDKNDKTSVIIAGALVDPRHR